MAQRYEILGQRYEIWRKTISRNGAGVARVVAPRHWKTGFWQRYEIWGEEI